MLTRTSTDIALQSALAAGSHAAEIGRLADALEWHLAHQREATRVLCDAFAELQATLLELEAGSGPHMYGE